MIAGLMCVSNPSCFKQFQVIAGLMCVSNPSCFKELQMITGLMCVSNPSCFKELQMITGHMQQYVSLTCRIVIRICRAVIIAVKRSLLIGTKLVKVLFLFICLIQQQILLTEQHAGSTQHCSRVQCSTVILRQRQHFTQCAVHQIQDRPKFRQLRQHNIPEMLASFSAAGITATPGNEQ